MEKSRFWCHSGLLWRYHGRKRRKWTGGQRERERMFMKSLDVKSLGIGFLMDCGDMDFKEELSLSDIWKRLF